MGSRSRFFPRNRLIGWICSTSALAMEGACAAGDAIVAETSTGAAEACGSDSNWGESKSGLIGFGRAASGCMGAGAARGFSSGGASLILSGCAAKPDAAAGSDTAFSGCGGVSGSLSCSTGRAGAALSDGDAEAGARLARLSGAIGGGIARPAGGGFDCEALAKRGADLGVSGWGADFDAGACFGAAATAGVLAEAAAPAGRAAATGAAAAAAGLAGTGSGGWA